MWANATHKKTRALLFSHTLFLSLFSQLAATSAAAANGHPHHRPTPTPTSMLPTIAPPVLSSSLAPPPPLDVANALPPPATRLEAAAARLAAAVGDAGELVAAARALQADGECVCVCVCEREREERGGSGWGVLSGRRPRDTPEGQPNNVQHSPTHTHTGGVPAGVLRQLSTALRAIGEQQSAALAEAAALLDGAAAARTLADAAADAAGAPPPPRPLTLGERRALNQEEGTPEDEAAASAADAVAEVASVPSGGFVSLRVAGDLSALGAAAQKAAATTGDA